MRRTRVSVSGIVLSLLFQALCLFSAFAAFIYLHVRTAGAAGTLGAKFATSGWDVPVHFYAAGLALALVPLQLSAWVRRRAPSLHRIGGWLSAAAILLGGVSGLSLAMHAHGGVATASSFVLIAVLWLLTMVCGIRHALKGDRLRHRQWMMRCIAVTSAAITLRVMQLVLMAGFHWSFDAAYLAAAWFCWPFNLLVCELLLRGVRKPIAVPSAGMPTGSGPEVA